MKTNYKGSFIERMQRSKRGIPSFVCETKGLGHVPEFRVKMILDTGETVWSTWFHTKKEAEHDACRIGMAMFSEPLKNEGNVEGLKAFVDNNNYKGMIQEYAQRNKLRFPVYAFVSCGVAHALKFGAQITWCDQSYSVDAVYKNKKVAENVCAFEVLRGIYGYSIPLINVKAYIVTHNTKDQRVSCFNGAKTEPVNILCSKGISTFADQEDQDVYDNYTMSKYIDTDDVTVPKIQNHQLVRDLDKNISINLNIRNSDYQPFKPVLNDSVDHFTNLCVTPGIYGDDAFKQFSMAELNYVVKAVMANVASSKDFKDIPEVPIPNGITPFPLDACDWILEQVKSNFDNWVNYRNMLEEYAKLRDLGVIKYKYIPDVQRDFTGFIGACCIKQRIYVGNATMRTKRDAANNAAWYSFRLMSNFTKKDKLENTDAIGPNSGYVSTNIVISNADQGILNVDLLYALSEFMTLRDVMRSTLVSRFFYQVFKSDEFWMSCITSDRGHLYRDYVEKIGNHSNVLGCTFSLCDIVMHSEIWLFYLKKLMRWSRVQKLPSYVVNVSELSAWQSRDIETEWFGTKIIKQGYEVEINYEDKASMRSYADAANRRKFDNNSYNARRFMIPASARPLMYEIPQESDMRYFVDRMCRCYGGGIEVDYATDPYNKSYISILTVICFNKSVVIEIGCDGN